MDSPQTHVLGCLWFSAVYYYHPRPHEGMITRWEGGVMIKVYSRPDNYMSSSYTEPHTLSVDMHGMISRHASLHLTCTSCYLPRQ